MIKRLLLIFVIMTSPAIAQEASIDQLGAALDSVGFTRADLGFQPKGYWNRFPQPDGIPYTMPFFKDLFAEPLHVVEYTQAMGNAIRQYMEPAFYDTTDMTLHRLTYTLGVDRMMTGFRNYSVNLAPRVDSLNPMLNAFEQIYLGQSIQLNYMTFGNKTDWPYDRIQLVAKCDSIPKDLQLIVAELMLNIFDSYKWRQIAVRNIKTSDAEALYKMKDLSSTLGDGQVYYPEIDDVAKALDAHSLYYAGMKAAQATETASKKLKKYLVGKNKGLDKIIFDYDSPIGRIVISGTKDDKHNERDCAILIDLGGDDTYTGNVGGVPSYDIPIAVAIDCAGDDIYQNDDPNLLSQGAAILGAGILIDMNGNDKYIAKTMAQGCGFFGLGILLDVAGKDDYKLETSGQGCGYFGIGMNLDISGNDTRYIYGDGQGYGGVGGVGIIADYEGDDKYSAEPL